MGTLLEVVPKDIAGWVDLANTPLITPVWVVALFVIWLIFRNKQKQKPEK